MKLTKKIVKVAQSLGIIIDKPIVNKLKLRKGDYIEIDIKKIKENGI
jgi:antitoxin component of MazEF toxin-antitoxin module